MKSDEWLLAGAVMFFVLVLSFSVPSLFRSEHSRQWRLRDVCARLYMSESLLKKKLKEEGVSFSGLLLDVRMLSARRLILARLPVNRVAEQCGYIRT